MKSIAVNFVTSDDKIQIPHLPKQKENSEKKVLETSPSVQIVEEPLSGFIERTAKKTINRTKLLSEVSFDSSHY